MLTPDCNPSLQPPNAGKLRAKKKRNSSASIKTIDSAASVGSRHASSHAVRFDETRRHPERQSVKAALLHAVPASGGASQSSLSLSASEIRNTTNSSKMGLSGSSSSLQTDPQQPRTYACHWHSSYEHTTFAEKRHCFDSREATMLLRNRHSVHRSSVNPSVSVIRQPSSRRTSIQTPSPPPGAGASSPALTTATSRRPSLQQHHPSHAQQARLAEMSAMTAHRRHSESTALGAAAFLDAAIGAMSLQQQPAGASESCASLECQCRPASSPLGDSPTVVRGRGTR